MNDSPASPQSDPIDTDLTEKQESPKPADFRGEGRLTTFWKWLQAKRIRLVAAIVIVVLLLATAVMAATPLKYSAAGIVVKSTVDLKVVDDATKQPVPDAAVAVGGQMASTDKTGVAHLKKVTPGNQTVEVKKTGYKDYAQKQLVRFGHHTVQAELASSGIKVTVQVNNSITGKGVEGVALSAGDADAVSDDKGKAVISLPASQAGKTVVATLKKDEYNDGQAQLTPGSKTPAAATVTPAGKVYFLSNRSGRIDLYEANLDGTGSQVVLAGTGNETSDTGLLPSVTNPSLLALASSREGKRDSGGNLRSSLFIFDTRTTKLTKVEDDYYFYNYRAWLGSNLVYAKNGTGGNCTSIKAYNIENSQSKTLVSPLSGGGCPTINYTTNAMIFYSITGDHKSDNINQPVSTENNGLYVIKPTGETNKKISPDPVGSISQNVKDTIIGTYYYYSSFSSVQIYQSIKIGSLTVTKLPNAPINATNRNYVDSPNNVMSSFIEERDGKSELYVTDINGNNEKQLTSLGSVNQFVQWFDCDYIVFSVTKSGENALYVAPVEVEGSPKKIADFYRGNTSTYSGGYNPDY